MAPMTRAMRARASADRLPKDIMSDILERLQPKVLCRLRTVCRSWRSIISDQDFIRAHADRQNEPLLLAKFRDDDEHVYVVDLSGNVVKQIAGADGGHQVLRTRLNNNNLACLATGHDTCRLLNPATGGIRKVLPLDEANHVIMRNLSTFFAFGLVASTGEYKLLRCLSTFNLFGRKQLSGVQVLTITGGSDHAKWRPRAGPPLSIDVQSGVVVDGMVYFLKSKDYMDPLAQRAHRRCNNNMAPFDAGVPADCILSFDLAREEWRRNLLGPSSTGNLTSGPMRRVQLTLADLGGSLVLAHDPRSPLILDLWLLLDFEGRLWVKQYSISTESVPTSLVDEYQLIPLLVLDDGRLVIYLAPIGLLFICDPETNTFTRVDTRDHLDSVGVYTGSLLSLPEEGSL